MSASCVLKHMMSSNIKQQKAVPAASVMPLHRCLLNLCPQRSLAVQVGLFSFYLIDSTTQGLEGREVGRDLTKDELFQKGLTLHWA